MRIEADLLTSIINDFDVWIKAFKNGMGAYIENVIKVDVIGAQGPPTNDTDPLNPRGTNPQWKQLTQLTKDLKGSSEILLDTRQMINFVKWIIEDSDWDDATDLVKIGWFEDSGNRAYIAAIHEYGLTGVTFLTPDGQRMGGMPIGRTADARRKIQWWYEKTGKELYGQPMKVTGVVVIPERSMLRKAADMIEPHLADMALASFIKWLRNIQIEEIKNVM